MDETMKEANGTDDLFLANPQQLGFELDDAAADAGPVVEPEQVRAELHELLAAARAATTSPPWDARTLRYHQLVFPQMARWLPEEEARDLCDQFETGIRKWEFSKAA
jgi:hypothetical protein